ncbi:toprim domain-containing protein [Fusobacterium polymorphum]|uniref:toprim domain-containing protein n=1 Tax=Fusobacterium nucleatum subsp. polymorphum TaxID=76857 RepID=UPI0030CF60C6
MSNIKSLAFKDKLEKIHQLEDKIFNFYGVDINNFYCPSCNDKRLKPFKSKIDSHIKFKCYGCSSTLDIIDLVKEIDSNLKNLTAGKVVDYLLSLNYSNIGSASEVEQIKKTKLDPSVKDFDEFIGDSLNKFNRAVENNSNELEYLYSRGYTHKDLELLKNFVGIDEQNNIVFACSIESYILRLLKPWHDKKGKEIRYKNSVRLEKTRHYCYLLDTVNKDNIIKNNYNIFIFEGAFDTITFRILCKNKCLAFATGGADSNHILIANKINDIAGRLNYKVNVFIIFDNDEAGEYNTSLLTELFNKNYINVYTKMSKFLFKNSKDISEEFRNNRDELETRIEYLLNKIN